jgi:hypothetical protein
LLHPCHKSEHDIALGHPIGPLVEIGRLTLRLRLQLRLANTFQSCTMDHSHHGTSRWSTVNQDLARRYWYTVAGFVGALILIRGVNVYKAQTRSVHKSRPFQWL